MIILLRGEKIVTQADYIILLRDLHRKHLGLARKAEQEYLQIEKEIQEEFPGDPGAQRIKAKHCLQMKDAAGTRDIHMSLANMYANSLLMEVEAWKVTNG